MDRYAKATLNFYRAVGDLVFFDELRGWVRESPLSVRFGPAGNLELMIRSTDRDKAYEASRRVRRFSESAFGGTPTDADMLHVLQQVLAAQDVVASGGHVFYPTADEFRVCSEVDIPLQFGDYHQPFPVCYLVLPAEFHQAFDLPPGDGTNLPTIIDAVARTVSLTHVPGCALVTCVHSFLADSASDQFASSVRLFAASPQMSVEDVLETGHRAHDANATLPPMAAYHNRLRRAAINYITMVMTYGRKPAPGDARTQLEAELARRISTKANRHSRREAERAVRDTPSTHVIAQDLQLGQREAFESADPSVPAGWRLKPHHRRAHWAWQPHGPRQSQRKLIVRPFTWVNRKEFTGDPATDVTYEARLKEPPTDDRDQNP